MRLGLFGNFPYTLYTSSGNSNFWKNCLFGWKNLESIKKLAINKVESSLKSSFDLKQILENSAHTKPFNLEL